MNWRSDRHEFRQAVEGWHGLLKEMVAGAENKRTLLTLPEDLKADFEEQMVMEEGAKARIEGRKMQENQAIMEKYYKKVIWQIFIFLKVPISGNI